MGHLIFITKPNNQVVVVRFQGLFNDEIDLKLQYDIHNDHLLNIRF